LCYVGLGKMAKVALLVGVGEYQSSELPNLAAVEYDVRAMHDVLVQPEIGGFAVADVTLLLNPEPQQMREVLERLFADRQPDDLLLLYFSGHGVVDDFGNFYLTTALTDQASPILGVFRTIGANRKLHLITPPSKSSPPYRRSSPYRQYQTPPPRLSV
jgi:Caspase domain